MEKLSVDLLITNADVLTFDDANTVLRDGAIAIAGNSIVWMGKSSEAAQLFRAKESLPAGDMIAMPGLVDCHVHTAQQFLRGKLASLGYKGSLREPMWKRYLIPYESGLEPEDVYCSGLSAYSSMISCGTTCFLEAGGPCPDEMGRAADEIGIRGRIAMSTMDQDDSLPIGFSPEHGRSAAAQRIAGETLGKTCARERLACAAADYCEFREAAGGNERARTATQHAHPHAFVRGHIRGGIHHRSIWRAARGIS